MLLESNLYLEWISSTGKSLSSHFTLLTSTLVITADLFLVTKKPTPDSSTTLPTSTTSRVSSSPRPMAVTVYPRLSPVLLVSSRLSDMSESTSV